MTPAGKIQILGLLAEFGIFLKPEKVFELLGLDVGYSISQEDVIQQDPQVAAQRSQRGTTPISGSTDTEAAFL